MIVDFAGSNPHAFYDPDSPEVQRPPFGGWAGRVSTLESWSYLDVTPDWLHEFCKKNEFNPRSVVGYWRQQGWIATVETTVAAHFGKGTRKTRVYRLTRTACDEVIGVRRSQKRDKGPDDPAKGFSLNPIPESCSVHVSRLGINLHVPGWDGDPTTLPDALAAFNTLLSQAVFDIEDYIESAKKDVTSNPLI
jgi:hypothetical protein